MTIDINELRMLAQAALAGPDGISLNWAKLLQDFRQKASPAAVSELLDRLEAAEKERDILRAKIAEMERQEPVATVIKEGDSRYWMSERLWTFPDGKYPLYALPGAKVEEK